MSILRAGTVAQRTVAGDSFSCSNRTYWHLLWTIWWLRMRFPKARLRILQPCYRSLVPGGGATLSKGTHDYDCVFDVEIVGGVLGADWSRAQKVLRKLGWAADFRHTGPWANRSEWHIHMISLPPGLPAHPTALDVGKAYAALGIKVGYLVDGGYTTTSHIYASSQVVDYYNHEDALADHAPDPSWHPSDINATVFRRSWWFNRVVR